MNGNALTKKQAWPKNLRLLQAGEVQLFQIADDENIPFMKMVYAAYDKNFNYGERYLNNGVIEVCIRLINNIPFNIYCQKITVENI